MTSYVVASSKQWHRQGFDVIKNKYKESLWKYVTTQDELLSCILEENPRYIFFLHWSWVVPTSVLRKSECICFHMTDVPYGRGGSPLQNLILSGKKETVVTALRMTETLDAGPVYLKKNMTLDGNAKEIYLRAGDLSWGMISFIIEREPQPYPQSGEVTIFQRRNPPQSKLPESGRLSEIYDFIRMLDAPTYPLAFIEYGQYRLEFSDANYIDSEIHARVTIRPSK